MANELQAYTTTGKTLYAVLISAAGQAWNGAAFEAIQAGNWTDYDIVLTEATAGLYLANLPALVAGIYSYVVFEQAGANPAVSDTKLGVGYLNWDGSAILPLSTIDGIVDDILVDTAALDSRLTAARGGYLDKLNVSGALAHSDAAATYRADVSALALEATLTAIKGAGWTAETLKAIADAIGALNDPTPQQVWEYASRSLSTPNDYKADVSALLTAAAYTAPDNASITAIKAKTDNLPASPAPASEYDTDITQIIELLYSIMGGEGWTDETLVTIQAAIEAIAAGATAQEVWEYTTRGLTEAVAATVDAEAVADAIEPLIPTAENIWTYAQRTLTWTPAEVLAYISETSITQIRGNTWEIGIDPVTLGGEKQQIVIKRRTSQPDADAILFVDTDTGLLRYNGAAPDEGDETKASLVYAGTTLTLEVDAEITAQLPNGSFVYGIQTVHLDGSVSETYGGVFTITADVVRAVE